MLIHLMSVPRWSVRQRGLARCTLVGTVQRDGNSMAACVKRVVVPALSGRMSLCDIRAREFNGTSHTIEKVSLSELAA